MHLFKIALFFMGMFSALRGGFLAWNWHLFADESWSELARSFVHGLRFDAAITGMMLGPLFLLNLCLGTKLRQIPKTWWYRAEFTYLALCTVISITPHLTDMEHFHYIGRRATIEMFVNPTDFAALAFPLVVQFWYLVLAWLALGAGAIWLVFALVSSSAKIDLRRWQWLLVLVLGTPLIVVTVRGGLQKRPLNAAHAITMSPSPKLAALALNSSFTLLRSIGNNRLSEVAYFSNDAELYPYLQSLQTFSSRPERRDNLVVIIMESLGAEFLSEANHGESRIPFVESLGRDQGLLLVNCLANGGETGYAHNSILASLPQMMPYSIIGTVYENNEIIGLGSILKKYHYTTSFFHGGPRGLFNFDIRARTLGFDHHYYQEDYPDQQDFDGQWGIYDEPFLGFAAEQLKNAKPPFATYLLTLSNHPPYRLPTSYHKPDRRSWTAKEHTAYYADQAVAKFFAQIADQPWFNNTLFVITGDHVPFELAEAMSHHPLDRRRIPLVFYHPRGLPEQGVSLRLTQQADILPSVLDFFGLGLKEQNQLTPFGRSVFTPQDGLAVIYRFGSFELYSGDALLTLKGDHSLGKEVLGPTLFPLPPAPQHPIEDERVLKAFVQYFTSALIKNRFYPQRVPSG